MSEKIEPIKGIDFTFEHFLWKEIAEIRDFQNMNEYYEALKRILSLINYLPHDFQIKMKFKEKAQKIMNELNQIRGNESGVDFFTTDCNRINDLDHYAENVLSDLLSELCLKLDKKGYMEKPQTSPRFKSGKLEVPKY